MGSFFSTLRPQDPILPVAQGLDALVREAQQDLDALVREAEEQLRLAVNVSLWHLRPPVWNL